MKILNLYKFKRFNRGRPSAMFCLKIKPSNKHIEDSSYKTRSMSVGLRTYSKNKRKAKKLLTCLQKLVEK